MQRYRQTIEELLENLSVIEADWKDEHSSDVISLLKEITPKESYSEIDLIKLFQKDFNAAATAIRLLLDLSDDEFTITMKNKMGNKSFGIMQFKSNPDNIIKALSELGIFEKMDNLVNRPLKWYDIIIERLKSGRGSAIKGQTRGRYLEDFTEKIIKEIFSNYDSRCRFIGASGTSTEKTDFAIPSKEDAKILIEVKAYGATGSKQTDVLGDITRIVDEKRDDTDFLLVTDGITWQKRKNDLRKLVNFQNLGKIARIYTISMAEDLKKDLIQLKNDHGL